MNLGQPVAPDSPSPFVPDLCIVLEQTTTATSHCVVTQKKGTMRRGENLFDKKVNKEWRGKYLISRGGNWCWVFVVRCPCCCQLALNTLAEYPFLYMLPALPCDTCKHLHRRASLSQKWILLLALWCDSVHLCLCIFVSRRLPVGEVGDIVTSAVPSVRPCIRNNFAGSHILKEQAHKDAI